MIYKGDMYENPKRGKKKGKKRPPPGRAPVSSTKDWAERWTERVAPTVAKAMRLFAWDSLDEKRMIKVLQKRAEALWMMRSLDFPAAANVPKRPFGSMMDPLVLEEMLGLSELFMNNSSMYDEATFLINWAAHNYPVFRPSTDMFAGVLLSDPLNMLQDDLKLPFPAFVVELPPEYRDVFMVSHPSNRWPLEVVGFSEIQNPIRPVRLGGGISGFQEARQIPTRTSILALGWADAKMTTPGMPRYGGIYATLRKQTFDDPDGDLATLFTHGARPGALYFHEMDEQALDALMRIGVGMSLYVQAKEEPLVEDRERAGKARMPQSGVTQYSLGRSVKLPASILQGGLEYARTGLVKQKVSSFVRGHWRNQAYGPGRSLRRPKWIRPYPKGEGPMKMGQYDVNPEEW